MEGSDANETASYNLLLILPVALSAIWVLIDLFYTSWLLALIANFLVNAYLPKGSGVHIGRLKISLLTGRIIFKDVQYYDRDNSIFITDGYGVLRWWKKETNIDDSTVKCKRCGSQSMAGVGKKSSLVFLQLNGVEYHWYNRKDIYDEWGKPKLDENENEEGSGLAWIKQLRPSIHCSINKGRILVGNQLTERTLVVYVNHAEGQYRMTEASNSYDELMHVIRWHGDKVQAVLEPSVGYNGPHDAVPSCGEVGAEGHRGGYLLLKTDSAEGVYSLDIPGLVPMNDTSSPKFALDVFLGRNSVINYGSYANRQRVNLIQKFFFPNDYTIPPVSRIPQPGERRIYTSFDVSVYVLSNATLNLFFEEKQEIRCLTFRVGGDSCLCINQPWITRENGYTTSIKGKATDIEALTSLPYESLGRCQVFEIKTDLFFPRVWNSTQRWDMKLGLSSVQACFLFQYLDFFNALIDDWLGNDPPDLLEFVPLDWKIELDMNDYEVFLHSSPYNWIDITTEGRENTRIAFCGKTGHMSFEFPFMEFLPIEQRVSFTARGQNIVIRKYIPPSCSTRDSQFQLSSCCKNRWRLMDPPDDRSPLIERKLMRSVSQPLEIFDPELLKEKFEGGAKITGDILKSDSFKRSHIRRGSEPLLTKAQIQTIPMKDMGLLMEDIAEEINEEETVLTEKLVKPPLPFEASNEFFPMGYRSETCYEDGWLDIACGPELLIEINYKGHNYDPTVFKDSVDGEERMVPNEVHINVEAPAVLVRVFGSLANDILALRDNFVSEYMYFKTYFSESTSSPDNTKEESQPLDLTRPPDTSPGPNVPTERFLNVLVDFKLHDIMGELPAHLPDNFPTDFPLISGMSELFSIHVDYTESETRVHLHVDPITINSPSPSTIAGIPDHSLGYLTLSSVDFRCHGFTEYLLKERIEYAWMMKLDLGQITGTLSAHQLLPAIDFFQTAANHVMSSGDDFVKPPDAVVIEPVAEPLSELIKYKLVAVNISTINVNIKEKDSVLKLKSSGFSLDLCNLHSNVQTLAVSLQLHHVTITSFIAPPSNSTTLVECGHADIGTIRADVDLKEPEEAMAVRQLEFLKRADLRSHRLWFIWDDQYSCGCCGGCLFLSSSINRMNKPNIQDSLNNLVIDTSPPTGGPSSGKEGTSAIFLATPSQFAFKSLKTLHHLHSTLVSYHFSTNQQPQFVRGVSIENTPTHIPPATSLPSINVVTEDNSPCQQDSDNDSFHSAQEYLIDTNEEFHSSFNTPRSSVRQHSRQPSKQSIQTGSAGGETLSTHSRPATTHSVKKTSFPSHYNEILNSYKCRWKTVKLYWKAGFKETPPTESKGLRYAGPGITPKRGRKSISPGGPRFMLEVLEFVSAAKRSPYILSSHQLSNDSTLSSSPKGGHKKKNNAGGEEGSAMFSVEVEVGTFDVFLSPPLLQVIDRYIDCADVFFATRSPHLLLEALTLDSLSSIQSQVEKIKKSSKMSPPIPSSTDSPLAHLFVSMEPSAHGSIQIVQTSNIVNPCKHKTSPQVNPKGEPSESRSDDTDRTSLVCLYTSGLQGNALVHHNSIIVRPSNSVEKDSSNLQMTLKVAGKFCLPVFQAGMFAINMSSRGEEGKVPNGITRNYSFLDFSIEPSSVMDRKSCTVSVTNVAELSMNKFQLTTAAKIIQSEFSSSPILMWADIPTDTSTNTNTTTTPTKKDATKEKDDRDSEQTNNSMLINISVPSVRLQMAGPRHGVPTYNELCVDVSQLYALVEAWKPLVELLIDTVKVFWRNKIKRDRQLLLSLITSAMDTTYRKKVRNPLLTSLSCSLRESVVYSVIQQLWLGLPLATADRFASFPSQYQEGFLLQEIVATLISLALRLQVQRSSLSAVPCLEQRRSRPVTGSGEDGAQGYFSISPSASELAMLNSSFVKRGSVNIDYLQLLTSAHMKSLLFIRETLLPFFLACNVKIAQQLNKQYHNSLKLSMDYHIHLEEAAILVIDGREDRSLDSVDDSVGVVPEFLLDQLYITGSLEHVKESRVIVQSSGHLVTIRSTSDSNKGRKLRSNVTSKCYLGLDTIATHITLPLLMLVRHTSHSLQHWRKSFQSINLPSETADTRLEDIIQNQEMLSDSTTGHTGHHSWITTARQLVEILNSTEKRKSVPPIKASSSKQATPRSSQRNLNTSANTPNYPLSIKALGAISKAYGLEESDTTGRRPSIGSNSSRESPQVKIDIPQQILPPNGNESITSPGGLEVPEDTTDSAHVFSSDAEEGPMQTSMATYAKKTPDSKKLSLSTIIPVDFVPELSPAVEMPNMNEILAIPDNKLEFSVYGSVRVKSLQVSSAVETLLMMLEVRNISGAIDCRQIPVDQKAADASEQGGINDHTPLLYKLLPTYLSISSTLQQCCIRVFDSAVSKGDLAVLSVNPLELCTSLYYDNKQPAPAYRALFRLPRVELDMKEPPIVLHKKFHKYVPTFTAIFNEVFAPSIESVLDEKLFSSTSTPSTKTVSDLQFPPHLPRGSFLFNLAWFRMIVRPLSTLTVKYHLAPVTAQLGTSSVVRFSMNVGQHNLEFTPKESKDELSLRNIPLPTIALKGSVVPRPSSRLPSISAELAMKQVVVSVTTDVFNQLLLLQTSFIKEINDLISMFFNIGESLPQEKITSINLKQSTESGFELISLLSSVKLSLQGIKITVSTPTQTALRFSTGNKIEMLITNPSHQTSQFEGTNHTPNHTPVDQLTLHGKVETEISVSLGVLQDDPGDDEEDDFVELAYFKTWITVKNTLQQNTSLLAELGEEGGANYPASLDTFLISIMAPHLYIQSTAVEKAILFWVNCKSVYNYWQNEHKLLNAEVQAATEEFMERFKAKQATQIRAPSFDFSKPRLVQISVNDVGACMPLVALPTTPHSSQKGFPALVFTIKDMQVILNLSKKLGSAGRFSDFCIRFDERFHFRHKTWTVDPKKHKSLNYGVVPNGTYRFSIVNQPTHSSDGGEKLFSSFTWHMSGIHTNSTTLIGRHISTLVRTLTAIGSDLEEPQHQNDISTSSCSSPVTPTNSSPKSVPRLSVKRRYSYSNFEEEDVLRALEVDLAKQTRKLQKLRQSGATPDSLKNEEDNFHRLEVGIARELRKVFRKGRSMSFQQWGQLLYPRSPVPLPMTRKRFGTLPRRKVTFEEPELSLLPSSFSHRHPLGHSHSPRTHARHQSDITPDMRRLIRKEQEEEHILKETVPSINLEAVMEDNENEQYEERKGEGRQKGDGEQPGGKVLSESLIPSIDIEINVTIKVDSGEIILLSEDVSSHDQNKSIGLESPLIGARRVKQSGPSVHTVLYIPAVEVKAHYQSILGSTYTTAPPSPNKPPRSPRSSPDKTHSGTIGPTDFSKPVSDTKSPVKKGILSVVTVISSLDDDLKLNPSILDFIEQVVRPINISAQEIETAVSSTEFDPEDEKEEEANEFPVVVKKSDGYPLSFPVDVSLNFQVLPSKIILTCNPHARVQCQIVIPTVSFMVSFSLFSKRQYDTPMPLLPSSNETTNLSQSPPSSSINSVTLNNTTDEISAINNINMTGCFQTFQLIMFTPNVQTSFKNSQPEDKEVISLVLGQAFIHLSRSSVFVNEHHPCQSVDDYVLTEKLKVSVIPHIESLILFYDWRRLNDVTWFRKCWYHTSFVEALFIGRKPSEESPMPHPSSPYRTGNSEQPMWSPGSSVEESSTEPSTGEGGANTITAELVVAVSIADMRLAANVAQLMGNAYIQVSHLRGVAHADIKDNELVFMDVDGTLEDFEIDAQGGVVAGNVKVQNTAVSLNSSNQTGCIPEHKASVSIHEMNGHIDYMSARILLFKGTNVRVKVWDSWEGINLHHNDHSAAKIQVCCSFCWSTCQISIHGTTAKGMFGILQRIYDFIIQQKKRSERTIGSMIPAGTAASTIFANYQAEQKRAEETREAEIQNPLLEHHHWMWAVKVGSIKLMNALGIQISADKHDVSLGGVINVSGDNLSVVCFHGTSFREKEWVVFNIDMISAMFSTLAIPGLGSSLFNKDDLNDRFDKESKRRICQQVCVLTLGDDETSTLSELAAIYHVTAGRGGVPPVSPKEISEWLNYVCINYYLNSVHKTLSKPVGYPKESQKLVIQPVSCLPACSFKLINDHLWPSLQQLEEQVMRGIMESATVECTLQTTFSGGIAVTTTVENYLFLHDLFSSYIDCINKQNVSFHPPFAAVSQPSSKTTEDDEDESSNCLRRFVSVHWELEPRIVLLATAQWASGHFNPHITWVLEKLGFQHARTTIPKYIQRGLMDPLDLGIASIVELLIELSATKKLRTIDESSV